MGAPIERGSVKLLYRRGFTMGLYKAPLYKEFHYGGFVKPLYRRGFVKPLGDSQRGRLYTHTYTHTYPDFSLFLQIWGLLCYGGYAKSF